MAQQVLLADHAFAVLVVTDGLDGGGAFQGEGAGVAGRGGVGLRSVEGVVDGAVVVEGAESDSG